MLRNNMAQSDRLRQGGQFCSAVNCQNGRFKSTSKEKRFHNFPKDEERCKIWMNFTRRKDFDHLTPSDVYRKGYCLCSDHFEESQYNCPTQKKSLVWNAVPTVFSIPNPPCKVTSSRKRPMDRMSKPTSAKQPRISQKAVVLHEEQADIAVEPGCSRTVPDSPTKAELKMEITNLKEKLSSLMEELKKKETKKHSRNRKSKKEVKKATILKQLSTILPSESMKFFRSQLRESNKSKNGYRWTENDKVTALSLLHTSLKAYRLLKKIFLLPSVSTLKRTMQKIKIYPGFSEKILEALKVKIVAYPPNSNLCALLIDEMTIKEQVTYNEEKDEVEGFEDFGSDSRTHFIANHATVFMLRGLISSWKQPVGYFLSSGPMPSERQFDLIKECVNKVQGAGLKVKVIIADQGANNRKTFEKQFNISESHPFLLHNNKKIFFMYDPPHLLKNIRNNLKKHGFLVNGSLCSWEHIANFFKFDKQNSVRMAPKLTEKHMILPPFSKMNVSLAAQVLSHSVAAGISTLVQFGTLPDAAKQTALFIERFDQLFNAFNSSRLSSGRQMGHAMSPSSGHKEFLCDTLQWLRTVETPSSNALPCLTGWKMTVQALLELFDELQTNHGISFLLTDRLNQDCLENFFSCIRGKGGHLRNPTAEQFRLFFRQLMIENLFHHSRGSNCQKDNDSSLLTLTSVTTDKQQDIMICNENDYDHDSDCLNDKDISDKVNITFNNFDDNCSDPLAIFSIQPPPKNKCLNIAEENVLHYISGYLVKKLMGKICDQCKTIIAGSLTGSESEEFLINKQFGGLYIPSTTLSETVKILECAYCKNIDQLLPGKKVKCQLIRLLWEELKSIDLCCPLGACDLKGSVINLFINVRLHFSLKDSSVSFFEKGTKRNQKMLKLHVL